MWKFAPMLKPTIWGGNKIASYKGIPSLMSNIGESWEVSGVRGSESVVEEGPDKGLRLSQLLEKYGPDLLGERNYKKFGNNFPLLIKFIDADADLSVQVHPDDELASKRGLPNGKNEMWYVVKASKGAKIANGFLNEVNPNEYDRLLANGDIEKELNYMHISKGDVYYIPAGRVHAICAGAFVAEIQQTSDVTYRIYDYCRRDKDGNLRELHTEQAREAINYSDTSGHAVKYKSHYNIPVNVIRSQFFCTNILNLDAELMRDYSESDTFVILIAIEGEMEIECAGESTLLSAGHSLLVPASALGISIKPRKKASLLETYIP